MMLLERVDGCMNDCFGLDSGAHRRGYASPGLSGVMEKQIRLPPSVFDGVEHRRQTMELQDSLDAFMLSCGAKKLSSATVDWYEWLLFSYYRYICDSFLPWDDPDTLDRFLGEYLEKQNVSDHTVHAYYRALRRFFNWLKKRKRLFSDNPMEMIDSPQLPHPYPRGIEKREVKRLLADIEPDTWLDRRDRAIILFLWDTGVRVSELCGLEMCDLKLKRRKAKIRNGKGKRDRTVCFGRRTQVLLVKWLKTRSDRAKCNYIFINRSGNPLRRRGLASMLNRRQVETGIEGPCNPHAFRHGFATAYLDNGGCIHNLQHLMGHVTLRSTERYLTSNDKRAKKDHKKVSPGDRLKTKTK